MDGSAFLWYIEVKDTAKKRRKWNMDQKEIEALIAAGGAPCEICGGGITPYRATDLIHCASVGLSFVYSLSQLQPISCPPHTGHCSTSQLT